MDEKIFLEQGKEKLQEVLEKLAEREALKNKDKELASTEKALKKELTELQKDFDKAMDNDIKRERENYVSVESRNLEEANSQLKKEKSSRGKAKRRGMKERMEVETRELVTENRGLHRQIRKTLKENDLPSYCDTNWFYALYYTQGLKEVLIKIAFFLVGLVGLPYLIVNWLNWFWLFEIVAWVVVEVLFLAIYVTILLLTKDKDNGTIEDMREFRDKIHDNERQIRAIKKKIKNDRDESQYNLESFDESISDISERIAQISKEKQEKEDEFDSDKKPELIEQIQKKYHPLIEEKEMEIEKNQQSIEENQENLQNSEREIEEQYEKYLTKNLTNKTSIEKMITLIDSGEAETISQALEIVRK